MCWAGRLKEENGLGKLGCRTAGMELSPFGCRQRMTFETGGSSMRKRAAPMAMRPSGSTRELER